MKFDYTHGNEAKYMVSRYGWATQDQYYVDSMATAKKLFEALKGRNEWKSTSSEWKSISIYDLKKDVRKAFVRKSDGR